MKTLFAIIAVFAFSVAAAFAGEAEGVIEKVDAENYIMTLNDGVDYKLPEELDLSLIGKGMKVALAFDDVDGAKVVTDMEEID